MRKLIVLGVVGLFAQLVDGSLGMGYGVTSSTLLVLAGLTPAAASASVHFSELGTNLASGVSHWRLKERRLGASSPGSPGPGRSARSWVPRCSRTCRPRPRPRSWP